MSREYRVGLVVPSSNTTMESEIPEILCRRGEVGSEKFTFHSSRVRLQNVSQDELNKMVRDSDRCALELSDAHVDAIAYACLVAVMCQGPGYHKEAERRLAAVAAANGAPAPVVSSAGALVRGLKALGLHRVAIITPYMKPLTQQVIAYLSDAQIQVVDAISLEIPSNLDVARHDPMRLPEIAKSLQLADAEAIVLSACVQMRSLPAIPIVERQQGMPVLSAAAATAYELLSKLGCKPVAPRAGALLAGQLATVV